MKQFLELLFLTSFQTVFSHTLPPPERPSKSSCGCVEADATPQRTAAAWETWPTSRDNLGNCERHCAQYSHFTLTDNLTMQNRTGDQSLCECFKSLHVFDCDEEVGANVVKVFCVERKNKNERDGSEVRDVMAQVKKLTREGKLEERINPVDPYDDNSSIKKKEEGEEKGKTLGLVALVLGVLALVLIAGLGTKSCLDSRREREKQEVADKIAAAAKATTDGYVDIHSFSTASTKSTKDSVDETERSTPKRLTSLSAGPFVYERH